MAGFINFYSDSTPAELVNITNLSLLADQTGFNKKRSIVMRFADWSEPFQIYDESNSVAVDALAEKIQATGRFLLRFPQSEFPQTIYINPDAVTSIMAGAVRNEDGRDVVTVFMDVEGFGPLERRSVDLDGLNAFVDSLRRANPALLSIGMEKARTRFTDQQILVYDPRKIERICPGTSGVLAIMRHAVVTNMVPYGLVDFRPTAPNSEFGEAFNDYMARVERAADALPDERSQALDWKKIGRRGRNYEDRYRGRLCEEFAVAIAAKTPGLVRLQGADGPYYTKLDNIARIRSHDSSLAILYKGSGGEPSRPQDSMNVLFKTPEAAQAELKRLEDLMTRGYVPTQSYGSRPFPGIH